MTRPLVVALTGSIGMGKSTTAAMFADEGVPVWDADAAVHRLYAPGGEAVGPVGAAFPDALRDGGIDRGALRTLIQADRDALDRLNALVHPLVAEDRDRFITAMQDRGEAVVLVDVPLLFETGAAGTVDAIVVVTAPADVQRARVLARDGMTPALFETILARQTPDADKRANADYLIETVSLEAARDRVQAVVKDLRKRAAQDA